MPVLLASLQFALSFSLSGHAAASEVVVRKVETSVSVQSGPAGVIGPMQLSNPGFSQPGYFPHTLSVSGMAANVPQVRPRVSAAPITGLPVSAVPRAGAPALTAAQAADSMPAADGPGGPIELQETSARVSASLSLPGLSQKAPEESSRSAAEQVFAELRNEELASAEGAVEPKTILSVPIAAGGEASERDAGPRQEGVFGKDRLRHLFGQDGVTPIPIKTRTGRRFFLWTFGDTILKAKKVDVGATFDSKTVMIPNSLAITQVPDDGNYKGLKFKYLTEKGKVAPFIKSRKGEDPSRLRFWANNGTQIGNAVYVYYMVIDIEKQKGQATFRFNSTALAKWDIPPDWDGDINKVDFQRVPGFAMTQALLGDGVVRQGEYLHLLSRLPAAPDSPAYIDIGFARVKAAAIGDPAAYEYLSDSGSWGKDDPAHLLKGDTSGEASLSYDQRLRQYSVVHMKLNGQLAMVTFADFDQLLAGRYEEKILFQPEQKPGAAPYYSGKEIFRTASHVYVIYIDPSTYQPMLIKAPLSSTAP